MGLLDFNSISDFKDFKDMSEQEWKLKVVKELTEVKVGLSNLANLFKDMNARLPVCEKKSLTEKVETNRSLIYIILGTYVPMFVGLAYFVIKGL